MNKDKENKEERNLPAEEDKAKNLITELGLFTTGTDFESDIQYINIIGSIEGHMVLPADNGYVHLLSVSLRHTQCPRLYPAAGSG